MVPLHELTERACDRTPPRLVPISKFRAGSVLKSELGDSDGEVAAHPADVKQVPGDALAPRPRSIDASRRAV